MKTQKRLIVISIVTLAALLLFAAPVAAQAVATEITGTESCITTDPGTLTFLPNGNIRVRGMLQQCTEAASDPRAAGTNFVVVNANWNSSFIGPMWGTWRLVSNDGGIWEGTWEGMLTESAGEVHAEGDGEGIDSGSKMWIDSVNRVWRGRILDPHGD